jgi:hypothetical protein
VNQSHHADDNSVGSDRGHLRPVPGQPDDIERRRAFEAAHPDITISPPETHASLWKAWRGGKILATGYHLGDLLDSLDWVLGQQR